MLRLVRGQGGHGLRSMQSSAEIPDCWGHHGVHQSGIHEEEALLRAINDVNGSREDHEEAKSVLNGPQEKTTSTIYFEDGGVRIYRPLLNFSKDRLQSTCLHYRIPWVEDETNQDASRTPRNAVRQLLNSGKLPKALQKSSLLAIAERMLQRSEYRIRHAEKWFHGTQILMFDLRTGTLVARLPARAVPTERIEESIFQRELNHHRFKASLFLRRLLEIVSPTETISLQELEFPLCSIFPDLDDPEATAVDKSTRASVFCTQGVQLQRVESSLVENKSVEIADLDPDFIWILTRQPPYERRNETPSLLIPASQAPNNTPESPLSSHPSPPFSSWHLFDGRYWIRLSHSSPHPLLIRTPTKADMTALRETFRDTPHRRYVEDLWKTAAPGRVRLTLPVIAEAGEGGRVLAMPTLGVVVPDVEREIGLRWEVRYKKVDWGGKWVEMERRVRRMRYDRENTGKKPRENWWH